MGGSTKSTLLLLAGVPGLLAPAARAQSVAGDEALDPVDFSRDVRPLLSRNCFQCHGPDDATREAGLRLDAPGALLAARESGVIVPGDAGSSELYRRITSPDPAERMPPPSANKDLAPDEIELVRRWIDGGAAQAGHWSFRPVRRPEPPDVERVDWPRNEIDAFVLAALERRGLAPSPEADRRTLLRRVTLDLTGLPPTPAELRSFLEDDRPDAYERRVDELFQREAHAERMTLAWMDAARYGDTSVFHADGPRDMWPWRDWVIRAYAENMPFDRFTVEQLAGDLVPDAELSQVVASGFLRNNGTSDEGGAIDEELRVLYAVDRVKTTGNVWLGLSTECAQCHEHKYDPITNEDYYRLFAYFDQSREPGMQTRLGNQEPLVPVPSAEDEREIERLERRVAELEAELAALEPPQAELAAWVDATRAELLVLERPRLGPWWSLPPFRAESSSEAFRTEFGPELPPSDDFDPLHELAWSERPDWTDGEVHEFEAVPGAANYLHRTIAVDRPTTRQVSLGSDDTLHVWLNGELLLAKESSRGAAPDQDLLELPLVAGENELLLKVCNGGGPSAFYFELRGLGVPDPVIDGLRVEAAFRNSEEEGAIRGHFVESVWAPGVALTGRITAARSELEEALARVPTVMVMGDVMEGRTTYVLDRGQYDAPLRDRPVEPGVLEFLLPLPDDAPANRLGLARWLVHPDHPLTSRVAVNRYWALFFGTGIVETVMDFGSQGAWPSHPELLDWLAHEFVASGWDVRAMLRRMVTSATYRQASGLRPELTAADPRNRLLGRSPRLRLQGEFLRDQALAVGGLLVDRVGGPGVKPYQPPGLWNEVSLDKEVRFEPDSGEKLYRRSMYTYWKRSAPMPALTIFDAPTRETCVVQRQRTNTPLQALVTLNDVQFVEAARHLAERMLEAGDDFGERLDAGFELCTGRQADDRRGEVMGAVYEAELAAYGDDPEAALALLSVGESARDESRDPAELAAWTVVASMLLNLDETLTRE